LKKQIGLGWDGRLLCGSFWALLSFVVWYGIPNRENRKVKQDHLVSKWDMRKW